MIEVRLIDHEEDEFHIIIGNDASPTTVYLMSVGRPIVYEIDKSRVIQFYDINVFRMLNRFVALVYLRDIDYILLESPERDRTHLITVNRSFVPSTRLDRDLDEILSPDIDGIPVLEETFRRFYQSIVALAYDAEIEGFEITGDAYFAVTFIQTDGRPDIVTRYYPFNNDFYAVQRDNNPIQFVVNKHSVDIMYNMMDRLVAGERIGN
jgi:hypothetical protein